MIYLNNNKTIIVEPHGGLANRMRVIASVLWLSDIFKIIPRVIWNENSHLNCPFNELFELNEKFDIIEEGFMVKSLIPRNDLPFYKRLPTRLMNNYYSKRFNIITDNEIDILKKNENSPSWFIENLNKRIYINTCEEFGKGTEYYKYLKPVKHIEQQVKDQCVEFNSNTIGLHIRRTDNSKSIAQSPDNLFIDKIGEYLKKNSETKFFLATDDPGTETKFYKLFGDRIITRNKQLDRNNKDGVKDALIDALCLANTSKIYGSYWSSFSTVASRIKKIPMEKLQLD